jgi:hypothetical protein
MPRRGVRPLRSRSMLATLKLITGRCAKYYEKGLDEDGKRALIQDIWRYSNFAIIADNKRNRPKRRKPSPKRHIDLRLRRQFGVFKCESAEFNGAQCAIQCGKCRGEAK